ncbi:MAG: glycosyltransferase family 2 protein [Candidatus Sabulitectum sp.]|nr:glycosyltransferase family 2 protein [Candidatus Sabulitectum sp.]
MILSKKLPCVGVLMINYNQWELTRKCVESLLKSEGIAVVIGLVDNNSREPAPSWVENTSEISFYQNSDNYGFIAGNIKAYEMVILRDVDFVILLNNDTEVAPNALKLLVTNFKNHPDTGLVTPAITYAEDRNVIWHAGGTFIPRRMGVRQLYSTVSELPENAVEVDQVSGCAMMMRPELFKRIGYQNPDLFIYHEDVEQSLKSKEMGFKNYLVPAARVIHHVSITVGGVLSPFAVYFTHRNRYIFARRNLKGMDLFAFRLYYLSVTLLKTVIYPVKKCGYLVYWMWLALLHGVMNTPRKRPRKLFL